LAYIPSVVFVNGLTIVVPAPYSGPLLL
jgi:hypothetical protein